MGHVGQEVTPDQNTSLEHIEYTTCQTKQEKTVSN